jgi:O-antigen/teichoic acid export membrane protein
VGARAAAVVAEAGSEPDETPPTGPTPPVTEQGEGGGDAGGPAPVPSLEATIEKGGTQRIGHSALITALSNSILPVTSLASGPILAHVLGPESRGIMAAVLAPLFVMSFVASMAIPDATVYVIAGLGTPIRRAANMSTLMLVPMGTIAAIGIWLAAPILMHGTPEAIPTLRAVVWVLPFLMIALMQRGAIMGNRNYRLASLERSTAAFGRLGLIIAFALVGVLTATTAVWANIAPNLAAMVLLGIIIRRVKSTTSGGPSGVVLFKKIGAYAFKGWGGVSANLVNWRLDQAILPALTHAAQLGYYAVAVSLAEIPSMMIGATKNVVFSEASHRNDPRIAARGTRTVILISVIIDVGVAVLAKPIITILFGHSFLPAVLMARILLVGNVPWIAEVVLAAGLLSSGRPGLRSTGQIVAAVITVGGLIVLVPILGALGAAWVSLVAYTINFVLTLLMFHHVTKIRYRDCVLPRKDDVVWVWNFSIDLLRKGWRIAMRRGKDVPA